jgi:hypothetical protein
LRKYFWRSTFSSFSLLVLAQPLCFFPFFGYWFWRSLFALSVFRLLVLAQPLCSFLYQHTHRGYWLRTLHVLRDELSKAKRIEQHMLRQNQYPLCVFFLFFQLTFSV